MSQALSGGEKIVAKAARLSEMRKNLEAGVEMAELKLAA